MKRWLVQLQGSVADLNEFATWFPNGDIYVVSEPDATFLVGGQLNAQVEAYRALEIAEQTVEQFFAVISLLNSSVKCPSVGGIFSEDAEGSRKEHYLLSASVLISLTGKCRIPDGTGLTQTQILLSGLQENPNLRNGLLLWAGPQRTWPRLYRILEEIEIYLGERVNKAAMCTDPQRSRFTRSANTAEVAGKDSRHAAGIFAMPVSPMSLAEATAFIRELLLASLRKAQKYKS